NYTLSFSGNSLTITPATLTVSVAAQSKVYGQSDPTPNYTVDGLQLSDTAAAVLSGTVARAPGETVADGPYAITQGNLAANGNYMLSFSGNSLTITPATMTVTAAALSKVYGQPDPTPS